MAALRKCPHCLTETELAACPKDGFRTVPAPELAPPEPQPRVGSGTLLAGRYRLQQRIGAGGFGAVYKALNTVMDQTVAIKVLKADPSGVTPELIKRFHREARTASQLYHPNTIRVFDFGEAEDKTLYLVMEYLEGQSLAQLLRREGIPALAQTLLIGVQILRSLGEAHKKGIVHRDMKPENVFITSHEGVDDHVKVLDFGIAKTKARDSAEQSLTQDGTILGSPTFMAPELIQNRPIDARTDLYAVGVLLYRMLAGKPPFEANDVMAILFAHVHDAPPPLPATVRGEALPEPLREVVMRLLEKDPARRPQTAADVLSVLEGAGAATRPNGALAPAPDVEVASTPRHMTTPLTRPNRRALWAVVAIALVGGSAAAWYVARSSKPPESSGGEARSAAPPPAKRVLLDDEPDPEPPDRGPPVVAADRPSPPSAPPVLAAEMPVPPPPLTASAPTTRIVTNTPAEVFFNGVSIGKTDAGPLAWTPPVGAGRVQLRASPLEAGFKPTERTLDLALGGDTSFALDAEAAPKAPPRPKVGPRKPDDRANGGQAPGKIVLPP